MDHSLLTQINDAAVKAGVMKPRIKDSGRYFYFDTNDGGIYTDLDPNSAYDLISIFAEYAPVKIELQWYIGTLSMVALRHELEDITKSIVWWQRFYNISSGQLTDGSTITLYEYLKAAGQDMTKFAAAA